jgi:iron complex outermembrane receptor protein
MRFLAGCIFSFFLVCLFFDLHAQPPSATITGKIVTENGLAADGATIILLKYKDSSIVSSATADKTGIFQFNGLQPDNYLLLLSETGYQRTYSGPYLVKAGTTFAIPAIIVKADVKQLHEVSVTAGRPEIEASPGKLTINVQSSLMAQGNSVLEILRQSPGVRVDNGNLSIIGRQNALVTIDGKPTNLTGEDLIAVLQGMQANTIDRIELITGGSAKYDASSGGIINIVLKKGKNTGFNVSVNGGAGYGKYYKGNAGLVFNDRTDKFNIFGNYGYTDNKTFHDFTSDRVINFNNTVSDYNVDYNSVQKSRANSFGFGTDFYLSAKQTIGFLVNGSVTDNNYVKDNNLKIYNQSVLDSIITANSNLNRHLSRINYNLNYNAKLDSAGETISADFDYTTNTRSSAEYITNNFYNASGNRYKTPDSLQNLSPSDIEIWLARVDFTDPLSKTSKLEAGIKYSNVTSNNDLIFGPLVNGVYTSDPAFSNHFVYTENVNAAYVNYKNKLDKFNIDAGVRAEQTIAEGNSLTSGHVVDDNYTDLFPHLLLTYAQNDKTEFSLSYSRGITRPRYDQLNPFLYYVDLYDYSSGNPYLKPEYLNLIELSYTYNKTIVTTLYAHIVSNFDEFNFGEQNDTSKVNINTQINFGRVYNYGIKFFAPVVFTGWWSANFDVDAGYQRYVAYAANGNLNKGTQDIIFHSTQHFDLGNNYTAEIAGYYESPSFYGINQLKAYYSADARIGKQLFNKRGSIKLEATDIFNTLRDRSFTNYENLNIHGMDKIESQVVRLTFSYRFGKTSLKTTAHQTGNEEEQKRANSSN